jgi:hypothetical protein
VVQCKLKREKIIFYYIEEYVNFLEPVSWLIRMETSSTKTLFTTRRPAVKALVINFMLPRLSCLTTVNPSAFLSACLPSCLLVFCLSQYLSGLHAFACTIYMSGVLSAFYQSMSRSRSQYNIHLSLSMFRFLYIVYCTAICLSFCMPACLFICIPAGLPVCLSVWLLVTCLSLCVFSVRMNACLSDSMAACHLSVTLRIFLSV